MPNDAPATQGELLAYRKAVRRKRDAVEDVRAELRRIEDRVDWDSAYAKRWREQGLRQRRRLAACERRLEDLEAALLRAAQDAGR